MIQIYVFLYQNLKDWLSKAAKEEFDNLCISILEFKGQQKKILLFLMQVIYVFLYQKKIQKKGIEK